MKIFLKNANEIKSLSDKQVRDVVTSTVNLKEMLNEVLEAEIKFPDGNKKLQNRIKNT